MTWRFLPYSLPLRIPYSWAKGTQRERLGLWVVREPDDGGLAGWGETAPPPHLGIPGQDLAFQAKAALEEATDALELGAALDAIGTEPRIRHGLLCAALDAQARAEGVPLARLLARRHGIARQPAAQVPVNALVGAVPPAEAAEAASNAVAAGFRTIKVKSDGDPRNDLARLQAIRAAVGAEPRLRVDANEAWDPATALGHLRSLEPFGVEYVEQPVRAGRFQDLVDLARSSPVPIALDESMTGWPVVERFLEAGTRPVLILKPQRLGGPDHVLEVIESARKARLACVVTNSLETAVGRAHALHLASLLPQPLPDCGLATEGFLAADAAPGPRTRDGVQELPAAPGIGVDPQVEPHARHVRG